MNWLEITLDLQADLAEPASELLGRVAPSGVAVEMLDESVRVRAWLPDDEALPDRRRQLDEGLWHLGQIQPFPIPEFKLVEEQPWEVAWKEHYQPLEIGERLQILPSWMKQERGTRIPIYLQPGMAFGTGAHTTTRHCLEALELLVTQGASVADLGCGSGILAIAAALLGASEVAALDTDQQAVQLARKNVLRNQLAERVRVVHGSIAELEGASSKGSFELIVANIRASVLEDFIQTGTSHHLTSGGRVVMSGILEDQLDSLVKKGKMDDLQVERIMATGDWRSLVFSKRP
ncbi:MAG: 50S ribosomal protein L11 methyltransferase [Anaerolineales bacterium]